MTAVVRSVQVGDVGEPLDADDQRVAGGAGADAVVRDAERVAEPGAAGVEVEGARAGDAEPVGDLRADARDRARGGWRWRR